VLRDGGPRVSRSAPKSSRVVQCGHESAHFPQIRLKASLKYSSNGCVSDARLTLIGVKSFLQWGIGKMGALPTGIVQSWLTVATVVLSQLFTLLFIGVVSRLLQRKARGLLGEQSPWHRASTSTQGRPARRLSRLAEIMTRSRWVANNDAGGCGRGLAQ
jgi:hypothetical protein